MKNWKKETKTKIGEVYANTKCVIVKAAKNQKEDKTLKEKDFVERKQTGKHK